MISIIGLFCTGREIADGQSIKSWVFSNELERLFGKDNIKRIDTYGWKKHPIRLLVSSISAVWHSKHVVFMTDEGGIRIFPWLLSLANVLGKCKVHYVVIGGWLSKNLRQKHLRRYWLKKMDGIYVETQAMQTAMERLGFTNIHLLPNCKRLSIIDEKELVYPKRPPFCLCTFSRVMKEKGIEEAVRAVNEINQRHSRTVFTLDIYGQIDAPQQQWFEHLQTEFSDAVRYCGVVPYDQSTQTIKGYHALLFPTYYTKEGMPGTIIDALAAGVPIIASRWEGFDDILDASTCLSFPFGSYEGLVDCLEQAAADPDIINRKKAACLRSARKYMPESVMKVLAERLSENQTH